MLAQDPLGLSASDFAENLEFADAEFPIRCERYGDDVSGFELNLKELNSILADTICEAPVKRGDIQTCITENPFVARVFLDRVDLPNGIGDLTVRTESIPEIFPCAEFRLGGLKLEKIQARKWRSRSI